MYNGHLARMTNYVNDLIKFLDVKRLAYKTNNLIVTIGDDFSYYYADQNYMLVDSLISHA